MTTIAKSSIIETVTEALSGKDSAKWAKVLGETLTDFRIGEYPHSYKDFIFQKWERFKPTIYDAYCFLSIHAFIKLGEVALFSIPLRQEPYSDKSISENNEVLSSISEPYTSEFWGGTQDEDGYIEWNRPVHGVVCLDSEGVAVGCVIPPMRLPLEVGTCESEKMLIYSNGFSGLGVARWPYGSNKIIVMVREFYGSECDNFELMVKDTGESLADFIYDETRNPFIEWGRHKSKKKKGAALKLYANPLSAMQPVLFNI